MSAYYPTIAGVVADLHQNTGEARRALYERARAALVNQLKGCDPSLTEAEIARQRLALEEAIRRVEAEAIRRQRAAPHPNLVPAERARHASPLHQESAPPTEKKAVAPAQLEKPLNLAPPQRPEVQREQTGMFEQGAQPRALFADQSSGGRPEIRPGPADAVAGVPVHSRLQVMAHNGRYRGVELDPNETPGETVPSVATLSLGAQDAGMWSRAVRRWRNLLRLNDSRPVVLLFTAVYERARAALVGKFKGRGRSLAEAQIELKRLEREEAFRRVETDVMRRREAPYPNSASAERTHYVSPTDQESAPPTEKATSPTPRRDPLNLAPPQRSELQREQTGKSEQGVQPRALSADQGSGGLPQTRPSSGDDSSGAPVASRLQAMIQAARYQGLELDPNEFRQTPGETAPSAAALALWAQDAGMWSRAVRIRWRHLLRLNDSGPVVLLFTDGTAGLLTGANDVQMVVYLKDPYAPTGTASVPVDELRLSEVWAGEAVLLRATRGHVATDALFNLRWLIDLVLQEHRSLRDIALASLTISFLTIFPPLLVMMTVNKVLQFHSVSTLVLLSVMMVVVVAYEMLLGHARRLIISVISARLDAKLNLHLFNRLLRLPLDYFERHPAGETMYRIAQIYRVREFLTGRLLSTFLDLITLCVLLPLLFYLNATLASIVLVCAVVITLIIMAYLKPLRVMYSRVTAAETWKSAALGETIAGIKTIKALALEPQRRALWDERIAEAGKSRLAFARLANWPQTLVMPLERLMVLGTMMIGAYMAMNDPSGYLVGGLFAFLMLSQRVSQPLVSLSRLVEDHEEVGAAIGEAGSVLNRPLESIAGAVGLRPKFIGAISFQDVTFTYAGTKVPALDRVSFSIPAGTILGIVGRSGSGKSTITRLLQGINRDYEGFLKIDGSDLREIDLRHLRQSLGVVLQNNFLFRGSIRDNIIAGRPGLTLADAVHAARLAGAEEFIERMPNGYETYIEEGSPNLSGGQTQRIAIARALIHDPRILLLDEATSALDPESEAVVSANLLRIAHGRTMVLVSHRLSSLMECNQILVIEAGKVVDIAPHSVLLERCSLYRQLWSQQNRHLESQSPRHAVVAPRLVPGG